MSHLGIRDDGPGQPPWCRGNATAVSATSKTAIAAGAVVLNRPPITRGTDSSNPSPSSEESRANLKTTSGPLGFRDSIAIRVPKKTPAAMITDTGKVAGVKPATGRLCQAGLREKASVRHLARRLTVIAKKV